MKDAEFVSKLISLMDDNYFSRIISLSLNRGVIVPGFSMKKSGRNKIPKAIIISTLNLTNKKGKHNYEIIFESIIELHKDNQNQDISLLACKWKNNEQEHNEIEKILIEMISEKTLKTNENSNFSEKADKNNSIIQLNNDINLIKKN